MMLSSEKQRFRVVAPDAGRPDVLKISAALRQLQGCVVNLELALTPLALEIRFGMDERDRPRICAVMQHLYPGARLEPVAEGWAVLPPATARVELGLGRPLPYPLKTWLSFHQNDPVAALGGAVRELQAGEALESRLALAAQTVDWRPPVHDARYLTPFARMLTSLPALVLLMWGIPAFFCGALAWYGQNTGIGLIALVVLFLCGLGLWVNYQHVRWLYELPGPDLERVKGEDTLFSAALTLTARAATPERAQQLLAQWQGYYQVFNAGAAGNSWVPQTLPGLHRLLEGPRPVYMTAAEIAGHWHAPVDTLESPFSARQGYRPFMPPPALLEAEGLTLGQYQDGAALRTVHFDPDLLNAHALVLGKTQSGKSCLVERLCEAALADRLRSLLVIDPHSTLVRRLAGKIPPARYAETILWDLQQTDVSLPLNLLALPGADQSPEAAADQIMDTLRAQWADSWGPRLEYHLSYMLRTLLLARLAAWPTGAGFHPFTLLDVQQLITDPDFRDAVLSHITDSDLLRYWQREFKPLLQQPMLFQEVFLPILNKVGAFQQRELARRILGQYSFTPAVQEALERPGIVLVDLAQGAVGADTARLVGGALLLAVRNLVARRPAATAGQAVPLTVVVDELQWLNPGALDRWMAELTKYGAHLIGVTQSLELLDAAAPALRPQVLANISSLFSFALMADDAKAVAPQFDGVVEVNDLLNLTPRQCYAKVFAAGQRQPTFSMSTWPLADTDPALVEQLLAASAAQWGTPAGQLEPAWQKRAQLLKQTQKAQVKTHYAN